jgi:hypothetical protein
MDGLTASSQADRYSSKVCGAAAAPGAARAGAVRVDRGQHAGQSALLGGARDAAGGGVGGVTIEYDIWVKWPQSVVCGQMFARKHN